MADLSRFEAWLQQEGDELVYAPDGDALPLCPPDPPIPGAIDVGSAMPGPVRVLDASDD